MVRTAVLFMLLGLLGGVASAQLPDVMYYRFNEGAGTTTADLADPGVGSNPIFLGSAGFDTTNPALGAACFKAATPNASSQINTQGFLALSGDWTLEFYCYFDGGALIPTPSILHDGTTTSLRCTVMPTAGAGLGYGLFLHTSYNGHFLSLSNVLPLSTWTHFAFVHDSATATISSYVNGALNQTDTFTTPASLITLGGYLYVGGEPAVSTFNGMIDELRVWNSARTATEIATFYNQEVTPFQDNLAITAMTSPAQPTGTCELAGAAELVTVDLLSDGGNGLAGGITIPIDLVVDGGAPISELIVVPAGGVPYGAGFSHSFALPVDLSAPGAHTLSVTVALPGDQNPADDLFTQVIVSGGANRVTSFPYVQDFDSLNSGSTTPPQGWQQESGDSSGTNSDWIFRQGQAATASTSPLGDHTSGSGIYAYVEDSAANHAAVNLRTPCLDFSALGSPQLSFWFHSQDASMGLNSNPMSIDVIVQPAGVVTMDVFGPEANIGNGWMARSVDLSPFAGQTVQLVFRGRSDGGTAQNDTAIDDVLIYDLQPTPGQAPVAGTAVFDLNAATNGNGLGITSLQNGPYSAQATGGGPLAFSFEGEANRPLALLIGPLNPVAATYPNVGQLDIGGAVNPMTGIPASIQVLGDGFNPVDFFDILFSTGTGGQLNMNFVAPLLPPGAIGAFQALFSTGNGFFFAISNAVELTII